MYADPRKDKIVLVFGAWNGGTQIDIEIRTVTDKHISVSLWHRLAVWVL